MARLPRGAFDAVYGRGELLLDLPLPILEVAALDVTARTFAGADLPEYYLYKAGLDPNEPETTFSSRHGRDVHALLGDDLRPAPPAGGA